jgi:hypothetical protein
MPSNYQLDFNFGTEPLSNRAPPQLGMSLVERRRQAVE